MQKSLPIVLIILMLIASSLARKAEGQSQNVSNCKSEKITQGLTVKEFEVDFAKENGRIRPLHGVNCGPLANKGINDLSAYFKELAVPCVRLHDCDLPSPANIVDYYAVFPNFDADPDNPMNYNFGKTDDYINAVLAVGAEPIYRLGASAESPKHRIYNKPPKDFEKWVKVCINIVRHYNEGWANGYQNKIKYWEIWNEPDLKSFWTGSADEFFRLYAMTAKAIKDYNPGLQVGGPSFSRGGLKESPENDWNGFIPYCRENNVPLDFFSWHAYTTETRNIFEDAKRVRKLLDENGFTKTKSCFFEWNYFPGKWELVTIEPHRSNTSNRIGSIEGASFDASVLLLMQDSSIDMAAFYAGNTRMYGLFDQYGVPRKNFYAFKAFRFLLDTPQKVMSSGNDVEKGLVICAGLSEEKSEATIMISNFDFPCKGYKVCMKNLPWNGRFTYEKYIVDKSKNLELVRSSEKLLGSQSAIVFEDIDEVPSICLIRMKNEEQ